MTSTPEPSNLDQDNGATDTPQDDSVLQDDATQDGSVGREDSHEGDTAHDENMAEDADSPNARMEREVDSLSREIKIRVLMRYTDLSKNEIFRKTGTSSRTGRRMLSSSREKKRDGPGRTGRPRLVPKDTVQKMIEALTDPKNKRPAEWHDLVKEYGLEAHKHTVQRAMEKSGYKKCLACSKPYLTAGNRADRLTFARAYLANPRWQFEQVRWSG